MFCRALFITIDIIYQTLGNYNWRQNVIESSVRERLCRPAKKTKRNIQDILHLELSKIIPWHFFPFSSFFSIIFNEIVSTYMLDFKTLLCDGRYRLEEAGVLFSSSFLEICDTGIIRRGMSAELFESLFLCVYL